MTNLTYIRSHEMTSDERRRAVRGTYRQIAAIGKCIAAKDDFGPSEMRDFVSCIYDLILLGEKNPAYERRRLTYVGAKYAAVILQNQPHLWPEGQRYAEMLRANDMMRRDIRPRDEYRQ